MMKKTNYSQLELFSETKEQNQAKISAANSFFNYIWQYEKTILIIIGFLVIGAISFSLGVEKGKRITTLKFNSRSRQASKETKSETSRLTTTDQLKNEIEKQKTKPIDIKEGLQNYTIQVASYQTDVYAQKEAENLKKKGFSTLVLSKGNHTIVCVGKFPNKETATSLLSELKKRYRDCFIRRL